jgi:cob(I)alamin adenosyltransferase
MVRLSRIYTKTGDDGTTCLGDGQRLPKHHPRVAAYGTADELSSVLGIALSGAVEEPIRSWLREIQNDLFDLGADLAVPGKGGEALRITPAYTKRLEERIDEVNEGLQPLNSFVLAGGTPPAAWMHLARTVCRRAERHVCELLELEDERERVDPEVLRYLNRLSDLFFVLARALNDGGKADVLWKPGGGRE